MPVHKSAIRAPLPNIVNSISPTAPNGQARRSYCSDINLYCSAINRFTTSVAGDPAGNSGSVAGSGYSGDGSTVCEFGERSPIYGKAGGCGELRPFGKRPPFGLPVFAQFVQYHPIPSGCRLVSLRPECQIFYIDNAGFKSAEGMVDRLVGDVAGLVFWEKSCVSDNMDDAPEPAPAYWTRGSSR